MAENDQFPHAIKKGWRKPHRLFCGNQPTTTIVDASVQALKEEVASSKLWLSGAIEVSDALCDALAEVRPSDWLLKMREDKADPRFGLLTTLESLVADNPACDELKLAKAAALKVYDEFERALGQAKPDKIRGRLAATFGREVLTCRFVAPLRERIAQKTGPLDEEHLMEIIARVEKQSEKMLRPLFGKAGATGLRAPRRLTPQRQNTLEELNVGLRVQE
jgi:hypothetical protein